MRSASPDQQRHTEPTDTLAPITQNCAQTHEEKDLQLLPHPPSPPSALTLHPDTPAPNRRSGTPARDREREQKKGRQIGHTPQLSGEGNEASPNHAHLQHTNSAASTATPAGAVVPPPYSAAGGAEPAAELRSSLDCWACSVLVTAQNMVIASLNLALAAAIFCLILTPAILMVTFGFLCHSTVNCTPHGTAELCSDLLSDGGCVALLVVGFLLVTPLLVLALAAYCRLARHLQLGLCFIPTAAPSTRTCPPPATAACPAAARGRQRAPARAASGSEREGE
ncbi:hypothetical protein ANANG_G00167340 [Anguilla anguilla]|uniref:Transmembrane protein 88-like n=1 Tax=Anguilla anguilla TaxID=7936 RepID=A0A9D3RZF5_ANGAN|nr:hypothetical protein ANANG_G00167340 [Anguilla anguilla]